MNIVHLISARLKRFLTYKSHIDKLFEKNDELGKIGSKLNYLRYLTTIFPESLVDEIVFHGTMKSLIPKDGKFNGYVTYFSTDESYSRTFGFPVNREVVMALIDVRRPFLAKLEISDVPEELHGKEYINPRFIKRDKNEFDSVIGVDLGQKTGKTIAVFEPNQILLLGSQKDIEKFRNYLKK